MTIVTEGVIVKGRLVEILVNEKTTVEESATKDMINKKLDVDSFAIK